MSVVHSRLVVAAGLLLVLGVAACDRAPTAPKTALSTTHTRAFTIEGDTTSCRSGWIIVNGRYQCN